MIVVTAEGKTIYLGAATLEKSRVSPHFADSIRTAVLKDVERSMRRKPVRKNDVHLAAMGQLVVGQEHVCR